MGGLVVQYAINGITRAAWLIMVAVALLALAGIGLAFRPSKAAACDDATKPLVIECVAHGGERCIEQVQTLNGCVFK